MTEREVESREPLEWNEKNHTNGDPYEAHSEGGAYFWTWRKDIVKRPSDKWLLWLGDSAIATVRTLDEAKALAQRLQDAFDGEPSREPERVEKPTNCKHGKWGHKFLPDGSGKTGYLSRQEIFRPYKSNFCPDCGQSLKGASE